MEQRRYTGLQDLLDTLMARRESGVGMAVNMIGVRKRIIAFLDESGRAPTYAAMLNPEIIKKDGAYDTEEDCLSLLGGSRKCKRIVAKLEEILPLCERLKGGKMTVETVNALCRYFETLYGLNQNLIVLCGADIYDHAGEYERRADEVVMSVPRLVPYSFNNKTSAYEIIQSDGLMKFSQDIPFLSDDYEKILQNHKDCLEKVKKVRNKLEHEMHGAQIVASCSGTDCFFSVTYSISEQKINLCAGEIIDFVKDMNILFSKLQKLVKQFAYDSEDDGHPYIRRLIRCDFADFNRIFESDLLYFFGKVLQPF